MMLRKCCNHPDLLQLKDGEIPSDELFWERSGKLMVLKELFTEPYTDPYTDPYMNGVGNSWF